MLKTVSKKRLLSVIAIVLAFLLALGTLLYFLCKNPDGADNTKEDIFYYPADYGEDIFQNKAYMSFQRDLIYGASGVEQLFSYETDYQDASLECRFFLDYFQCLMEGDSKKLIDFYCVDYFDEEPDFTRQMIYDPYVLFHSVTDEEIDCSMQKLYNFHVRYRIFKNNGTFRRGVASNVAVPQIYQLLKKEDGTYQIFRILEVEFQDHD